MSAIVPRVGASAIQLYFIIDNTIRYGRWSGIGAGLVLYAMFALGRASERSGKGVA